jgi:hypothetical protein
VTGNSQILAPVFSLPIDEHDDGPGGSDVQWYPEIRDWVAYMQATGMPKTTVTLRRQHLQHVARNIDCNPYTLTFNRLVEWLSTREWAPNTRRSYRTSLRAFYTWAMATGRTRNSPAHLLPPVRVPRPKPRPTPEIAYRRALVVADAKIRRAIRLAGQCGLRRGEIARARPRDVEEDPHGYLLRVVGKGGHVRMVPEVRRRSGDPGVDVRAGDPPGRRRDLTAASGYSSANMRISEYLTYGLLLSGFGGACIGFSIAVGIDNATVWVLAAGSIVALMGGILLAIGVIAKGVEVGSQ